MQSKKVQLSKHSYGYDTIRSMTGMTTLSGLLTYNNTDTKGYTKDTGGPSLSRTSLCRRVVNSTAAKSKIEMLPDSGTTFSKEDTFAIVFFQKISSFAWVFELLSFKYHWWPMCESLNFSQPAKQLINQSLYQ